MTNFGDDLGVQIELELVVSLFDAFCCAVCIESASIISSRSTRPDNWNTHLPAFAANEIVVGVSSYLNVSGMMSGRLMVM